MDTTEIETIEIDLSVDDLKDTCTGRMRLMFSGQIGRVYFEYPSMCTAIYFDFGLSQRMKHGLVQIGRLWVEW